MNQHYKNARRVPATREVRRLLDCGMTRTAGNVTVEEEDGKIRRLEGGKAATEKKNNGVDIGLLRIGNTMPFEYN